MVYIFSWSRKASLISVVGVTAVTGIVIWRKIKECTVPVAPHETAIVYDTRRNRILYTTEDPVRVIRNHFTLKELPALFLRSSNVVSMIPQPSGTRIRSLFHALHLYSDTYIVVPPSPFYALFKLPKKIWAPPGETCIIHMMSLETKDGEVNVAIKLRYCISFESIERYIAAVGPQAPISRLNGLTSQVLRDKCAGVTVGTLTSRSRCATIFLPSFRETLASKVKSQLAVDLLEVTVERAESFLGD